MSKAALNQIFEGIPAGAWVAISVARHLAIAFGADARQVLNEARIKGERLPLMLRVPAAVSEAL